MSSAYGGVFLITGTVYGRDKKPIGHATTSLFRNGQKLYSTMADANGRYIFEGAATGDSLVFSSTGCTTGWHIVKGSAIVDIQLQRLAFVPARLSSGAIQFACKETNGFSILRNKPTNDSTENVAFEKLPVFIKIETPPTSLWKKPGVDSALTAILSREKVRAKKAGRIRMRLTVDAQGNAGYPEIIQSFARSINNKVAAYVMRFMKWRPAVQNGVRVAVDCELSFDIYEKDGRYVLSTVVDEYEP